MYYAYNSLTGRLIGASYQKAYCPQGYRTLGAPEPINPYPPTYPVAKPPELLGKADARTHSTGATTAVSPSGVQYAPLSKKLKMMQEKFQKPDGIPVHLKGGPVDKVLYYLTLSLCAIGVAEVVRTIYVLSFPRKPVSE